MAQFYDTILNAKHIPNSNIFHIYLQNGVLNMVIIEDSLSNSTCQNPFFTSKIENTFAFVSLDAISSITGSG